MTIFLKFWLLSKICYFKESINSFQKLYSPKLFFHLVARFLSFDNFFDSNQIRAIFPYFLLLSLFHKVFSFFFLWSFFNVFIKTHDFAIFWWNISILRWRCRHMQADSFFLEKNIVQNSSAIGDALFSFAFPVSWLIFQKKAGEREAKKAEPSLFFLVLLRCVDVRRSECTRANLTIVKKMNKFWSRAVIGFSPPLLHLSSPFLCHHFLLLWKCR